MAMGNNARPFDYPLHPAQCFADVRGSLIDLKGVPQIPQAAHAHMVYEGSEGQGRMDRELQRQCDEAIEAACHVIQHRHLLGLKRRDAGKFTTDEEDDAL